MENIYTFNCALWIKAFQWTKLVNSLNVRTLKQAQIASKLPRLVQLLLIILNMAYYTARVQMN